MTVKKVGKISIILVMCIMMLAIYPFQFVRKTGEVTSNMAAEEYGSTMNYINHDAPYVQTFRPQTSRLEYIAFKMSYEQDISSLPGGWNVQLIDGQGKMILEQYISFAESRAFDFWHVDVQKWVQKAENYQLVISVGEEYDNIFRGMYTIKESDAAPGSVCLYAGDEEIAGQALLCYGYGYPLNIKNILCIWGFLCAVCLSIFFALSEEENKSYGRVGAVWEKAWCFLRKNQIFILILELLGIVVLTAYICRNRAVDWDESYSFMMATRLSFGEMLHTTALDMHPPLYYFILKVFAAVFGSKIFTLKLLTVFMNALTMILGITMIRKHWGAKVAFLFNLVVGLGPQFIFYSVNLRMYALALFFVTWSLLLAYEIIREPKCWKWVLVVISGLGGVYTHYFTVVPMILIYGYVLLSLWKSQKKACKVFFLCCIATIAGYLPWIMVVLLDNKKGIDAVLGHLPWLTVVLKSFDREVTGTGADFAAINFADFAEWMFSTNIKFSVEMGVILYFAAVLLFAWKYKTFEKTKRGFWVMCAILLPISYMIISLLVSTNTHFMDNRYVFSALGTFWLYIIILFCNKSRVVSCALSCSLVIFVLSSYTIQKSVELDTNPYMNDTYAVLEQIKDEKVILYNFPTYHIMYDAHLGGKEYIYIEDMDWENWPEEDIYFICWGDYSSFQRAQEEYPLQVTDCGTMRFEQGVAGVKLYRIVWKEQVN